MKLGVFAVLFGDKKFEEALDVIAEMGLESIEIGTSGNTGDVYCNRKEVINDENKPSNFKKAIDDRRLEISALSCHGNPLHPNNKISQKHHDQFQNSVRLAEK